MAEKVSPGQKSNTGSGTESQRVWSEDEVAAMISYLSTAKGSRLFAYNRCCRCGTLRQAE